jgi:hypothetical protein
MAPQQHEPAVNEMKHILKPGEKEYLSAAKGYYSYMSKAEWERILEGFSVRRRGGFLQKWALVSKKQS